MSIEPTAASLQRGQARSELVQLCQQLGQKTPLWLQGYGGNVSRKFLVGGAVRLWIKASGFRVGAVTSAAGLAEVELSTFYREAYASQLLPARAPVAAPTLAQEQAYQDALQASAFVGTPSMETGLHALLAAPWVVHLHSLPAVLMAHLQAQGQLDLPWLMKRQRVAFVPALMPGLALTWAMAQEALPAHLVLANHGVVLALERPEQLKDWQQLEYDFCDKHGFDELAKLVGGDASAVDRCLQQPIPLRFYFPDTAVFFAKLQPCLRAVSGAKSGESLYRLETTDQSLQEIWAAQQILYAACPDLPSLPESITNHVAKLPTEQQRLAKIAS